MRSVEELLTSLESNNIRIWLDEGRLKYRAPKGDFSERLRAELVGRKAEIIETLSLKNSLPVLNADMANRHEPFPMTDIQQAYWVGRSGALELGNVGVHGYLEIENDFDVIRLNEAWSQVIERHEMLRAVALESGEQKILEQVPPYEIAVADVREYTKEQFDEYLNTLRGEMSHQVFPSDRWPLFDIRATIVADDRVRLHVSLDLLMADLWSIYLIFQDWAAYIKTPEYRPPAPGVSFRDYVLAERAFRETPAYQRAQAYWRQRLDELPLGPDLPVRRLHESLSKTPFKRFSARLDSKAWKNLKEKALKSGLTPSGVLLAAYAEIMGRWSKSPKFNINLTLFNRAPVHEDINKIVGDFTTTVLLTVDHSRRESFEARARRLQQQIWHDLDHRSVTAVQVLREMAQRRSGLPRAAMPVVFSSALGLDAFDEGAPGLGQFGTQLGEVITTISQTPQVWVDHQAVEQSGTLLFNWDAVDGLFPQGMIEAMFDAYTVFLDRLANSDAEWCVMDRDLVPAEQIRQRAKINATQKELPDLLLHELFLTQIEHRGDATAIISSKGRLSYQEVANRANKVGRKLRELGVQPNELAAIVMEKGWEQVVGVLGILASGGAYVPIDPDLPQERREQLLRDAGVRFVLTQSWNQKRLSRLDQLQVFSVDDEAVWSDVSAEPLDTVQNTGDLAYVIYTSGSTGRPKGVMIDHRGAVNTILDVNRRYSISTNDRVLALSALSFDLSVYDIFGMLAAGGSIVMPDAGTGKDPAHWSRLMSEHQVSVWNSVPALLQMLVEHLGPRSDSGQGDLRVAMLSGDWIPVELPDRVKRKWPGIRVISQGGATEASIWSIFYPIEAVDPTWTSIPYGKPLDNQSYHVFSQALEPCPVWVAGQLYIGGIGLAKGYWRDEEKTNSSFIIHPHTGERLYRTGDMGRYLPDGNIEFLGREDFQVKVNGYRIELGEIEAAIQQHPLVKESVVITSDGARDAKQLVAYVVSGDAGPNKEEGALKAPVQGLSPLDKLEFKLKQHAVRNPDPNQTCVDLRKPDFDDHLKALYVRHRAYREFLNSPIGFDQFSTFMASLLQMRVDESPLPKYRYPSAGSLYPVQTYAYVKPGRITGIEGGVYYYHPAQHQMVLLTSSEEVDKRVRQAHGGPNQTIFDQAAFSLFSIGEMNAVEPIYGQWSNEFCYLEAGYIGQLLMDKAPDYGLGLCPIGKVDFDELRSVFDWQPSQMFLQGFLGGSVLPEQIGQLSFSTVKAPLSSDELRDFLRQKLPQHMVPSSYILLDALPLSANGKLDRKALPKLDLSNKESTETLTLPATDLEKRIAAIVTQVLDIDQVGLNNNLFDLGADSVAIVRLNNRLTEEFRKEIPVIEMFQYPTVSYLATFLKDSDNRKGSTESAHRRAEKIRQARNRRMRT